MSKEKRIPNKELVELKSLLIEIKEVIKDNNQNTKDLIKLINDSMSRLGIEENSSLMQRLLGFLYNK